MKFQNRENQQLGRGVLSEASEGRREKRRESAPRYRCNICGRRFRPGSVLERFCRACKAEDELFRFHDCVGF